MDEWRILRISRDGRLYRMVITCREETVTMLGEELNVLEQIRTAAPVPVLSPCPPGGTPVPPRD